MKVFNILIAVVTILFIISIFILNKVDLNFAYQTITFNYVFLIILFFLNKFAFNLCIKNQNQIGSKVLKSLNIIASFIGILSSWIPSLMMAAYYFYIKDWMINIGGHNNGLAINQPYVLLILVPITTFLISRFVWNKNLPTK